MSVAVLLRQGPYKSRIFGLIPLPDNTYGRICSTWMYFGRITVCKTWFPYSCLSRTCRPTGTTIWKHSCDYPKPPTRQQRHGRPDRIAFYLYDRDDANDKLYDKWKLPDATHTTETTIWKPGLTSRCVRHLNRLAHNFDFNQYFPNDRQKHLSTPDSVCVPYVVFGWKTRIFFLWHNFVFSRNKTFGGVSTSFKRRNKTSLRSIS